MSDKDLKSISDFITQNHVISFCCCSDDDIWAANSFYIYDKDNVCFYFMSDPETRHGQLAINNDKVAGTINEQPSNILSIKGLQYRGIISLVNDDTEKSQAYDAYTHQFPIAKIKSLPIWKIQIEEMKFTNNSLGFGKKLRWSRT